MDRRKIIVCLGPSEPEEGHSVVFSGLLSNPDAPEGTDRKKNAQINVSSLVKGPGKRKSINKTLFMKIMVK